MELIWAMPESQHSFWGRRSLIVPAKGFGTFVGNHAGPLVGAEDPFECFDSDDISHHQEQTNIFPLSIIQKKIEAKKWVKFPSYLKL